MFAFSAHARPRAPPGALTPPSPRRAHPGRRGRPGRCVCPPPHPRCVSRVVTLVIAPPCRHVRAHTTPISSPVSSSPTPGSPQRVGLSLGEARPGGCWHHLTLSSALVASVSCLPSLPHPPGARRCTEGGLHHPRTLLYSSSSRQCSAPKPRDRGLPRALESPFRKGEAHSRPRGLGLLLRGRRGPDGRRTKGTPTPAAPLPFPTRPLCL